MLCKLEYWLLGVTRRTAVSLVTPTPISPLDVEILVWGLPLSNLCDNILNMLRIRLQRTGRKNNPAFRVVLTDSKNAAKSGKFKEILGSYDVKKGEIILKDDRIKYWMNVGAKPSDTVYNFLVDKKIIEGKKKNVLPKKSPTKPKKAKPEKQEEVKEEIKEETKEETTEEPKEEKKEEAEEEKKEE